VASDRYHSIIGVENDTQPIDKAKIAVIIGAREHFDRFIAVCERTSKFSQ